MTAKETPRATKRPDHFTKPGHWSSEPPPKPRKAEGKESGDGDEAEGLSPTRYGDWCKSGIAIDF